MEGGSYWLDKVQTSICRDVKTLAIEEAYTTKYYIHPGADTMLCGFKVTILWAVTRENELSGSNLVQETTNEILIIQERLVAAKLLKELVWKTFELMLGFEEFSSDGDDVMVHVVGLTSFHLKENAPNRRSGPSSSNNNENPDVATVIAQQLQAIITQVANNANNGNNGGGNGNGRNNGCSFKTFQSCNPKEYNGKGGAIALTR
ncbi:hypothetical protein Tco_0938844 [Tanacetum coccineum]|uniref:Uncharacterized protein n=1 Tax=Tanacetum coccineum TaxID=301880 RepID=A0ABQ5DQB3_9ASTR